MKEPEAAVAEPLPSEACSGTGAKILIVTGIFPPDSGGPASYVPKMATALAQRGHQVDVVTLSDRLDHDDRTWPFALHRIRRRLFWPWRLLLTILTIWKLARSKDIVYINGLASEAALGAWLAGRPAVHKIVGDYAWERARSRGWFKGTLDEYQCRPKRGRLLLLDWIRTWPLGSAHHVIVPSEYLRRIVQGWGIPADKVRVIYNAAEETQRQPPAGPSRSERTEANDPNRPKTVVTVCRLVPWKGVDALIRAVAAMPQTRLLIVGDGPLRQELEACARSSGAADRVVFVGQVPHAEVRRVLESADLFVLNSTYEGLPHVALEAMEAGVPVIATDAGGTGEAVEDGVTGLLIRPGDENALKAAITRLCLDEALARKLAIEARRRLATRFSFETMVLQTEALLDACAGRVVAPTPARTREKPPRSADRGLAVLSLGYTRGLWEGEGGEDYQRMLSYGAQLERYTIIVNSYRRHGLAPRQLAANVTAIPTNALTPLDSFWRMIQIGATALGRHRFHLIQAQDPMFTGMAAFILSRLYRVPLVVCVYGPNVYDAHWRRNHWLNHLLAVVGRFVLRQARCIQVDGRMTAQSLTSAGHPPEQIEVKPVVPCNLGDFLAITRENTQTPSAPRLLFAGRLATQKNLPLLLEAVKRLRDSGRTFTLRLAGDGPDEARLRRQVEHHGLGGCVEFLGNIARPKMVDVFREADLFVLSSDYEGFARVLMEAAAAALPIVTTAVSGADEAVNDGVSGFIVPIGDADALADKLGLLLDDAALRARMGSAGRTHIAQRLDPASNTPRQLAIWRKVAP